MRAGDQLAHQIKHTSQQQTEDYGPFVYGHIASYDPTLGRVRCVLPAMRDEGGNAILTGWMPLGTSIAGPGIGFQYAPLGGATTEKPTAGELVKISRFDRTTGVGHIDGFMFNQVATPPFPDLKPGELGVKVTSGGFFRFHTNGDLEFSSQGKTTINAVGDADITAQGALNIMSTGNATLNSSGNLSLIATGSLMIQATASTIAAMGGVARKLVTDAFTDIFNNHTHAVSGGEAQPTTTPITDTQLTSVLEAE